MNGAGREGEMRAADALEKAGLRIIARNIRSPSGEIDLIALDGETLVFIEVKAWASYDIEALQYGVNKKKQGRIIATAKDFLFKHQEFAESSVRFDVVFGKGKTFTHIKSAFMEET
jgi:putative endonuclease